MASMRSVIVVTALALLACNPGPGPRTVTFLGEKLKKDRTWAYQEWLKGVLYVNADQPGLGARTQLGVLFSGTADGSYLHDYAMTEYKKSGVVETWRAIDGLVACKIGTLPQLDRQFIAVHQCGPHQDGVAGICIEDDEVIDLRTACPTPTPQCFKQLCDDRIALVVPALEALRTSSFAHLP